MLKEWDKACRHRNYLTGRYVHVCNFIRTHTHRFALETHHDHLFGQLAFVVHGRVCLCDDHTHFFNGRYIFDVIGYTTINHTAIRRFKETKVIGFGKYRQRVNQTNVWAFGRFNRTNTTIMRGMYVSHFKACTFTSQTARP